MIGSGTVPAKGTGSGRLGGADDRGTLRNDRPEAGPPGFMPGPEEPFPRICASAEVETRAASITSVMRGSARILPLYTSLSEFGLKLFRQLGLVGGGVELHEIFACGSEPADRWARLLRQDVVAGQQFFLRFFVPFLTDECSS